MKAQISDKSTIITFDQMDTWAANRAAEQWCQQNGYSVGTMDRFDKRGLLKGNFDIAKGHNLTQEEIALLDGVMTGDFREGPVRIEIFEKRAKQ